jgi:homoserine dehydrogenase
VLSDISALRYGYKYEYKKINQPEQPVIAKDYLLNVIVSAREAEQINDAAFSHIAEWHDEIGYVRIRGTINATSLKNDNWWRTSGVSLVLCENAFASKTVNMQQKNVLAKEALEV